MPASKNPIPELKDYGIDKYTGFMPNPPPVKRLNDYYSLWENMMDNLPSLIMTGSLRQWITKLPLLDLEHLVSVQEQRRAHSVLVFLAHGYLYGVTTSDQPIDILPKSIAIPLYHLSKMLKIHPVVSYSSVGLWNWKLLDEHGPLDLTNMTCINTFTGAFDEAWFYLVPLAIEIVGAPIMVSVNEAQKNILADNPAEVLKHVSCIADTIANMSPLLKKMYDKCDPAVFWRRTRMYSGGSLNSKEFPNGVFYEGVEEV